MLQASNTFRPSDQVGSHPRHTSAPTNAPRNAVGRLGLPQPSHPPVPQRASTDVKLRTKIPSLPLARGPVYLHREEVATQPLRVRDPDGYVQPSAPQNYRHHSLR